MAGIATGLVQKLLEKLSTKAFEEISLAFNVKRDIHKLNGTMKSIENVLFDAEEKQNHDRRVSHWLEELRNVLYDIEDVLDEFECEAVRRKMMKQLWSTGKKVRHFFSINSNPVIFSFKMAHRIKEVNEALDNSDRGIKQFDLVKKEGEHGFTHTTRETHSYVDPTCVFGRDDDKEWVVRHLIHSDVDRNLSIISLLGIGGLGKTTLAQFVYNDKRVDEHFTKKMWVCVSEDFHVRRLIREILSSAVHSEVSTNLSMDELQRRLKEQLADITFLLVLDDVWNEDVNKWQDLKQLLMVGEKGSKILVTTRMNSVAQVMSKDELKYELQGLNDEDSWCLFAKCAFDNEKEQVLDHLKKVGEKIVGKCKGVPLAIRSMGSLLYSKTNIKEWEYVRDNEIWQLEKNDGILPALKLSYQLMPSYLKPCFVYCTLFPKDYEYDGEEVIQLWMANGLLHSENKSEGLEDIGQRYIEELCSRSLIELGRRDRSRPPNHFFYFKIHDLFHDLGISIGQDKYFNAALNTRKIHGNVQHIYISDIVYDNAICPQLQQLTKVRSFIVKYGIGMYVVWRPLFNKFIFLRVLDIRGLRFESLPRDMCRLKHLKYLALRDCYSIKSLPNSICELSSLQTLILNNCISLQTLPKDLKNLISLRYFSLISCDEIDEHEILARIEGLSNLQSLIIDICVNEQRDFEGDESGSSNRNIIFQSTLRSLLLHISFEETQFHIFERVTKLPTFGKVTIPVQFRRFADNLRCLKIFGGIVKLPEWLSELASLEILVLRGCYLLEFLPDGIKSLSTLQVLIIDYCGNVSSRCRPEVGEEWHKIAHVPTIQLDYKIVKGDAKFIDMI